MDFFRARRDACFVINTWSKFWRRAKRSISAQVVGEVEKLAFPDADGLRADAVRLEKTFAFSYALRDALGEDAEDGWDSYSPAREYARLGFLGPNGAATADWRLWNDSYALAETCGAARQS